MTYSLRLALVGLLLTAVAMAATAESSLVMRVEGSAEPPSSAGVVIAALAGIAGAPGLKLDVREGADAARDFKSALRKGEADLAEIPLAVLSRESAIYSADGIPFLATSTETARRLYAGLAPLVAQRLAEDDLVLLALEPRPEVGLLARRRIERADDLKGLTVLAPSAAIRRLAELVDARQVAEPAAADAMLIPAAEALAFVKSQPAPASAWTYYRLQGWHPARALVASASRLAAQPAAMRERLIESVKAFSAVWWKGESRTAEETWRKLAEAGVAVVAPGQELAGGLRRIGMRMADEWAPGAGADGAAFLAVAGAAASPKDRSR